jgi:hypothetical protein
MIEKNIEKFMKTSMSTSGEMSIEKNGRRKKLIQNKCGVSSQKIRMRKEEGATVAATPTFPQRAVRLSFVGQNGQINRDFSKPSGDTHKIPEKTNCRRDRDFQTIKTI